MKMPFIMMLLFVNIAIVHSQVSHIRDFELLQKKENYDSEKCRAVFLDYHQKHKSSTKNNAHTLDSLIYGKYEYFGVYTNKSQSIHYYDEFGFNNANVSKKWTNNQIWLENSKITYAVFLDSLEVICYNWNSSENEWRSIWKNVYVYNENGKETEFRDYRHHSAGSEVWFLDNLTITVYNENLQLTELATYYRYQFSESFLRPNSKYIYTYDENNLIQMVYMQYDFNNSNWKKLKRYIKTYDASNNIVLNEISDFDIELDHWLDPSRKTEYTYDIDGHKLTEIEMIYYPESSYWDIVQKYTWSYDTETPSFSKIEYYVEEDYDRPGAKRDINYDISGLYLSEFFYYYADEAWQPSVRAENLYDLNSNPETYNYYNWDWTVMSWKKVFYNDRDYNQDISADILIFPNNSEYNSLFTGLLNSDIKYDLIESQFEPYEKFSYYWSGMGSVEVNNPVLSTISLFPNPCSDIINFCFTNSTQIADFTLYDMQGRCILSQIVDAETKINVLELSSGLYMYKITDGADVYTGKLIKE